MEITVITDVGNQILQINVFDSGHGINHIVLIIQVL